MASIWSENMFGFLSLDMICSSKLTVTLSQSLSLLLRLNLNCVYTRLSSPCCQGLSLETDTMGFTLS